MGQNNTVPRRINRVEGALGQLIRSMGPGVCEQWANPSDIGVDYGLSFIGTVTGVAGAPKFQCSGLIGFGDGFFEDYWAYVIWDAGGAGADPQGQMLECTGYSSVDADFTVAAFAPNVIAVGDKVLFLHPLIASLISIDPLVMGRSQIAATTIDLNQEIATYVLFTGDTQDVIIEGLTIRMPDDVAGGALTSISIQTDDTTPQIFITAVEGAVANLVAEAQLSWAPADGITLLKVGKTIGLTIGGGAEGAPYVCDVVVKYRAVVSGGNLT